MGILAFVAIAAGLGAWAEVKSGYGHTLHDAMTGGILAASVAVSALLVGGIAGAILAG